MQSDLDRILLRCEVPLIRPSMVLVESGLNSE